MSDDTYTLDISIWNFAPEGWVSPEQPDEFEVADARIVGDSGDEHLVVEIERHAPAEVPGE